MFYRLSDQVHMTLLTIRTTDCEIIGSQSSRYVGNGSTLSVPKTVVLMKRITSATVVEPGSALSVPRDL